MIAHIFPYLSKTCQAMRGQLYSRFVIGTRFGGCPKCYGVPIIDCFPGSTLHLGSNVIIISSSYYTALGATQPVVLRTMTENASLSVGNDTGISGSSIIAAFSIAIGNRVLIGTGSRIFDTDFHPLIATNRRFISDWNKIACAPVTIEDDVFIGTGATVSKGVTIGQGSIVAAGSVVVKNVEPMTIVGGNPAKKIGDVPH